MLDAWMRTRRVHARGTLVRSFEVWNVVVIFFALIGFTCVPLFARH